MLCAVDLFKLLRRNIVAQQDIVEIHQHIRQFLNKVMSDAVILHQFAAGMSLDDLRPERKERRDDGQNFVLSEQ